MQDSPAARRSSVGKLRAEFVTFYIVAPVLMAVALPPAWMFPALLTITFLGVSLLHATRGFRWRDLVRPAAPLNWRVVAIFTAITLAVSATVMMATAPDRFFALAHQRPLFLLLIALLYPVLSALPQELVFRALFFRRYGALLPGPVPAIVLNAALFSLAHLMYWSWIVAAMTFFGGLAFAWAYEARRNFVLALLLHSIAGWIIFALGLGIFFYSGNVTRPF